MLITNILINNLTLWTDSNYYIPQAYFGIISIKTVLL